MTSAGQRQLMEGLIAYDANPDAQRLQPPQGRHRQMTDRTANLLGVIGLAIADRIENTARDILSHAGETPATLVVRRQLIRCHFSPANNASAATGADPGRGIYGAFRPWRRGKISSTSAG